MMPGILGLSHLGLSVRDRGAARQFWVDVMGFEVVSEEPAYCLLINRAGLLAIALTTHDSTVTGDFDEHNPGLDHLSYAVADVESLLSWQERLDRFEVPHSAIAETDAGQHLNLRAPDNIAIELYVMSQDFAEYLGLEQSVQLVAANHAGPNSSPLVHG
jgi:catechol 2,3-dioxygenase-like lactoylglutathione lyase family enzyme